VKDADPLPSNAGRDVPRQRPQAAHQLREPCRRRLQPTDDLVGALHDVVADVVRIGAAAPGFLLGPFDGELGLNVPLGGWWAKTAWLIARKSSGSTGVAVEHDRRRPIGLVGSPLEHGLEGGAVAVPAATTKRVSASSCAGWESASGWYR